jgi:hypothetical protein
MTSKAINIGRIPIHKKNSLLNDDRVEWGNAEIGTKPSDLFRGVWKKGDKKRSANEIREEAWGRNK